jgi:hypothetical protein
MLGLLGRIDRKLTAIRRSLGAGDAVSDLAALASGRHRTPLTTPEVVAAILRGDNTLFASMEQQQEYALDGELFGTRIQRHDPAADDGARTRAGAVGPEAGARTPLQTTVRDDGVARCSAPLRDSHDGEETWVAAAHCPDVRCRQFLLCIAHEDTSRLLLIDETGKHSEPDDVPQFVLRAAASPKFGSDGGTMEIAPAFDRPAFSRALQAFTVATDDAFGGATVHRIVRTIMRVAAGVRGGLDEASCVRLDAVLKRLRGGARRGVEAELATLLSSEGWTPHGDRGRHRSEARPGDGAKLARTNRLTGHEFRELLDDVESCFGDPHQASSSPPARLRVALELRPPHPADGERPHPPTRSSHEPGAVQPSAPLDYAACRSRIASRCSADFAFRVRFIHHTTSPVGISTKPTMQAMNQMTRTIGPPIAPMWML